MTLLLVLGALPAIWLIARAISRSLRRLAREAEAIRHFDFDEPLRVRSSIVEVHALAETMQLTQSTMRRFLNVVQAVAAEKDFDHLLPVVLRETMLAGRAAWACSIASTRASCTRRPRSRGAAGLDGVLSAAQKPYTIAVPLIDRQRETSA